MADDDQPATGIPATVVWDDEQPVDHAGSPVAPLTPAGLPYRWRLRLAGRSVYAVDADQVLAAVIDDYPTRPSDGDTAAAWARFEETSHDARVRHAFGVIVDRVAEAMVNDRLDVDSERVLQRSAERGPDRPPITRDDCPEWAHEVPMILIKDLYNPAVTTRRPPRGNIVFIDPGLADAYLLDLAGLGVIDLEQNPVYRSGGSTEILIPGTAEAT
jgi:hypothetical protein